MKLTRWAHPRIYRSIVARNRGRQLAQIVKIYLNTLNTIIKHFSNSAFFIFLRKRIDEVHKKNRLLQERIYSALFTSVLNCEFEYEDDCPVPRGWPPGPSAPSCLQPRPPPRAPAHLPWAPRPGSALIWTGSSLSFS